MNANGARTGVLMIDGSPKIRKKFRWLLESQFPGRYAISAAFSAEAGLTLYHSSQPDCILLDCNLLHSSAGNFFHQIEADLERLHVVVMLMGRAHEMGTAPVDDRFVNDFLIKDRITAEALHRAIQRAVEKAHLLREIGEQRRELEQLANSTQAPFPRSVAAPQSLAVGNVELKPNHCDRRKPVANKSSTKAKATIKMDPPAMSECFTIQNKVSKDELCYKLLEGMPQLRQQIERVAGGETTILLTGETGTGKTYLAKHIHSMSPRRGEPFVVIQCGALSNRLIESEIFGHVRGAFSGAHQDHMGKFAAAGHGTVFLDEIDALPIELQTKFLRILDERCFEPVGSNCSLSVQARFITASNRDLAEDVKKGRFRADLYHRINVLERFTN